MSTTLLPVSVLSGFFGAGKTTLHNRVLRNREGRRAAWFQRAQPDLFRVAAAAQAPGRP